MAMANRSRTSEAYLQLVRNYPLRPIKSDAELARATVVLDGLLDKPKLSREEQDYVEVLGDLIEKYESETFEFEPLSDAEMLAFLIQTRQVTQTEVAKSTSIPNSVLSNVLHGKRKLNRGQIAKLADYFQVAPTAFDLVNP